MATKSMKKVALEMYQNGWKVEVIAKTIKRSKSSVYLYIQEQRDEIRLPILKNLLKRSLLCGDFKQFIKSLSYTDICLIRRKFKLYGYDKESKINAILKHFKHYSILGLYPDDLTRSIIKKAFFRKAREVHPDINHNLDKRGREFQEVYTSYQTLLQTTIGGI